MPTVYSNRAGTNEPKMFQETGDFTDYAEYEASSLASGTTVAMVNIAPNVTVLGLEASNDAMGAGTSYTVGDAADADRFIEAVSSVSAGVVPRNAGFPRYYADGGVLNITTVGTMTGTLGLAARMVAGNKCPNQV